MKNLKKIIKEMNFDYVNNNITEDNFPAEKVRGKVEIVDIEESKTSEEVIKIMEEKGLIPANLYELLEYAKEGWNNKDYIVAFGSSWVLSDGHRDVPYLDYWIAKRRLHLAWFGNEWDGNCRFAAVKKQAKSTIVENNELNEGFIKKFWSNVIKTDTCWEWMGAKGTRGYGLIKRKNTNLRAHRLAVLMSGREIPSGYQVDHLCSNTSCVNPQHLEVVTSRENTLRGNGPTAENAKKTHCLNGHQLSGDNLSNRKDGRRVCKTCNRERMQLCCSEDLLWIIEFRI